MKKYIFPLLLGLLPLGAAAQSQSTIHEDFLAREAELSAAGVTEQLEAYELDEQTREAMEFLYAYMPWPDVADYSMDFYLEQVACALRARSELSWGEKVPLREWLHFVLPLRVNNENLDDFRTTCFEELKARVEGLSMEEAVKEVNHWCHEHVTYKPSDARTSSPLASMKTATGRCGEESTYTVAALRAVGIPARQVYTPRWAHTDDNHAWVEAWVDGSWCFLGACEPEAVLNLGWFNLPASRGMLMHTKVFGNYSGEEDVIGRTKTYTEINVTGNYAETARTSVEVVDENGQKVPGAKVEFKLYNYGELYTVQETEADADGKASILTGLGDMVVWASYKGKYGLVPFTAGKESCVTVALTHKAGEAFELDLTLVPPEGRDNVPEVAPEAAERNKIRFAEEDSIRTAYVHSFADSLQTAQLCEEFGLDYARVRPLVVKSCGNWENLFEVLEFFPLEQTLDLLESLSDKDLRDFAAEVIEDHLQFVLPQEGDGGELVAGELDEEGNFVGEVSQEEAPVDTADADVELSEAQKRFEVKYIFRPRIANEMLTPWRSYFAGAFDEKEVKKYRSDPAKFAKWIDKNIESNPEWNPLSYCLSPAQAMETKRADVRNKGILFVAALRSMGVPARIDEVTGKVQYVALNSRSQMPTEETANWQTVTFEGQDADAPASASGAELTLAYSPREHMENPGYYTHFSLSRLSNSSPVLQNYPETASWEESFKGGVKVDEGDYLLTSGTRLADGTVLARLKVFTAKQGDALNVPLVMREDKQAVQVIGSFNAENLYTDAAAEQTKSVLSTTGRGYYVLGLLRANHEPTNHVLHDIEKQKDALEAWGRAIVMVFPSQEEYDRFLKNRAEFTSLPSNLSFGVDSEGQIQNDLFGSGLTKSQELPLVVIADTFNRIVFASQGYTIGIGEQLKTTIGKLN